MLLLVNELMITLYNNYRIRFFFQQRAETKAKNNIGLATVYLT